MWCPAKDLGGYCGETFKKSPRGLIRIKGWLLLHEGVLKAQVEGEDVSTTDNKQESKLLVT